MQALFFLRHYNDLDHMTPVMWEWIKSGHHATAVVYSTPDYLADYRLAFLKQFERFSLHYVDEFLNDAAKTRKQQIVAGPRTEVPKDVRISQLSRRDGPVAHHRRNSTERNLLQLDHVHIRRGGAGAQRAA